MVAQSPAPVPRREPLRLLHSPPLAATRTPARSARLKPYLSAGGAPGGRQRPARSRRERHGAAPAPLRLPPPHDLHARPHPARHLPRARGIHRHRSPPAPGVLPPFHPPPTV